MNNTKSPLLLAHRGTSVLAPENTAPAFDFAMRYGADILEIDVRIARDGEVIVIHDETLDRTSDGSGKVADYGLVDLKKLNAGYRFNLSSAAKLTNQPQGEQSETAFFGDTEGNNGRNVKGIELLSLGELYTLYPDVGVNIDIKDKAESAVDAVVRVIERHEAAKRSVVASFHDQVLQYCRKSYPWLRTSAGMQDVKQFYWWYLKGQSGAAPIAVDLLQMPPRYFCIPLATRRFIDVIHRAEATVNYWTINQPAQMIRLINKGADGLVTDRMDLARAVITDRYRDRPA